MFGWFAPKCPLATWEKVWTETRMRWLADRFGVRRLLDAEVIRPAQVPCPAPLGRDVKCIRPLLDRMCGSMGIDPGRVALRIREDETMPGAAGLYERGRRAV